MLVHGLDCASCFGSSQECEKGERGSAEGRVIDRIEKLQPQATFPEQILASNSPGCKVISAAQSWARREPTQQSNKHHCGLLSSLQLCVVGLPIDTLGGWNVVPSASNPL